MLVTLLHLATVMKVVSLTIRIGEYAKCFLTMILSGIAGYYFYQMLSLSMGINLILSVTFTFTIYCILLVVFRLVLKEELKRIPFAGNTLSKLAPRR
jgi:stage V sporulation protein B